MKNAKEQIKIRIQVCIKAHEIKQRALIAKDLDEQEIVVDLLTVHSQDHLTMVIDGKKKWQLKLWIFI